MCFVLLVLGGCPQIVLASVARYCAPYVIACCMCFCFTRKPCRKCNQSAAGKTHGKMPKCTKCQNGKMPKCRKGHGIQFETKLQNWIIEACEVSRVPDLRHHDINSWTDNSAHREQGHNLVSKPQISQRWMLHIHNEYWFICVVCDMIFYVMVVRPSRCSNHTVHFHLKSRYHCGSSSAHSMTYQFHDSQVQSLRLPS